ncbi:DUF4376 domain-containing protein [Azospirillum sp. TSA6c]|uniref:DUF4376 domain-containing protein n=1 Tax=Azospirillum sp. TSA6c TaxID=709813 RepID=UPI000D65C875|nr:DUF4376 domain-containing protein [Azospirillum sp. TSA6c]
MDFFETTARTIDARFERQAATYTDTEEPEYDRVKRVWDVAPIPLDEIKAGRKAEATERRKVERDRGVVIGGNRWHSDEAGVGNVSDYINTGRLYEAGQGAGTYRVRWKTMDGFAPATLTDLQAAQLAIGMFVQGCFAREDELFTDIDAAETAEDVIAISLEEGWPDDGSAKGDAFILALQQSNARLERAAKEYEAQGDITNAQLTRLQIKEI